MVCCQGMLVACPCYWGATAACLPCWHPAGCCWHAPADCYHRPVLAAYHLLLECAEGQPSVGGIRWQPATCCRHMPPDCRLSPARAAGLPPGTSKRQPPADCSWSAWGPAICQWYMPAAHRLSLACTPGLPHVTSARRMPVVCRWCVTVSFRQLAAQAGGL